MRWQLVFVALVFAVDARATATFVPLGFLPTAGFPNIYSEATTVSADGSTVAGRGGGSLVYEPFRWTGSGGMLGLGTLPGNDAGHVEDISADGSTIVGYAYSSSIEAFRWTSGGGMVGLGALPGDDQSYAFGVSADGSAVVGESHGNQLPEAFLWTSGGGMVGLGFLPGGSSLSSRAAAISADGSTVTGNSLSASGFYEPFRWTRDGGMVGLGIVPGEYHAARAISADGSVIILEGQHGISRWTSDGGIAPFAAGPVQVADVSADGSIVVGTLVAFGDDAVVVDAAHDPVPLSALLAAEGIDLTGWDLSHATGISADGHTIVGYGTNPSGQTEAWLAVIGEVPEPGTALLVTTGVLGLAASRRRRANSSNSGLASVTLGSGSPHGRP